MRLRLLVIILRLGGCLTGSAFLAVLLPSDWMAGGVMLFIVASDPVRFAPLVRYVAAMNVVFGVVLIVIDMNAGLPAWWTLGEGPPLILTGLAVAWLSRGL